MQERISTYWAKLNTGYLFRRNLHRTVAATSLAVVLIVFWCLKLTGVTLAGEAFCGRAEHVHGEQCFQKTLLCELQEGLPDREMVYHVSDDAGPVGKELVYALEDDAILLPADTLFHTDACYAKKLTCTVAEHTHDKTCYSDLKADLESREDWEKLLAELGEGTTTAANVVTLAQSQVGYQESERNFEVDADLTRHGITRYGQWYGNPYGDWSAMFASFCLYYAGVEDAPANAGPESMRLEWAAEDMYRPAAEFAPRVGDVIFLRTEAAAADRHDEDLVPAVMTFRATRAAEPTANTVALIKEITDDSVTVIQGDVDGTVTEVTYSLDDPAVLGYGLVPEVSAYAARAVPGDDTSYLAKTIAFNTNIFTAGRSFVIYTAVGDNYYAIDGAGKAVPVYIDASGEIRMDAGDRDALLWDVTRSGSDYVIRNRGTRMYLHPFNNGGSNMGVLTSDQWPVMFTSSGAGALIRHTYNSALARLQPDRTSFHATASQSEASIFRFGVVENCTVWLDGTYSNLVSLRGSDKASYTLMTGDILTLPSAWKSPDKYSYVLQGWYDVKNARYYLPGEDVLVTENLLFYPDWIAETYDIGIMNEHVADTVSTAEYVDIRMFDYNALFNTLSLNNNYSGGDSATWTLVQSGDLQATGEETLDYIFVDYDTEGVIGYPGNRDVDNGTNYTEVTFGLYDEDLADILFDPDVHVLGKTYLGTSDYLFRYCDDPNDEYYGYYYYDSRYNAASYNQSRQRFYVYDYLERTTDSAGNDSYSDFLPLNSPYANTNDKTVGTYTYNGVNGEYGGVTHYSYDAKYDGSDNSANRMGTNYWFGMATDIEFYLPAKPGTTDEEGGNANLGITGEPMVFEFSGDDDVWVLIDDELVLDIGGVHTEKAGSINFVTGEVVVEGQVRGNVGHLNPGNHKLTMYYLERGGSMSNFKLLFNITPRYSMTLRKEDILTADYLDGAEFSIYLDEACTIPAGLWTSRESHDRDDDPTNVFTVRNGVANLWGLAAGGTYYLRETSPPTDHADSAVEGIVRVRLNSQGRPDYAVLPEQNGHLTVGFTAHGFKVDEDTQAAYLVISNTDATDSPPTQVYAEKVWYDGLDHSGDSVTVHLLANGVQIQSIVLDSTNEWRHVWENLPAKDADGQTVTYTVREATVPGYVGTVSDIGGITGWQQTSSFENGGVYLLKTSRGYIGADGNKLLLLADATAAEASLAARWEAKISGTGSVTLTNQIGQTLCYNSSGYSRYFYATSGTGGTRSFTFSGGWLSGGGYYLKNEAVNNGNIGAANNTGQALTITPMKLTVTPPDPLKAPDGGSSYRVTNTPVGVTVSLTVYKEWQLGQLGHVAQYESATVEMKLLANGVDAGLREVVAMRTGWSCTFSGLPKYDGSGNEIAYSVEEIPFSPEWSATYSPVTPVSGSSNAYEVTVTNRNHTTVQLPETVGRPPYGYTMLGTLIILGALGWYCGQRRRRERRVR